MIDVVAGATLTDPPRPEKFQSETFPPKAEATPGGRTRPNQPSTAWSLATLTAAARRENARIENNAKFVTPRYWRLGRVLNLVRKKTKFPRGTWEAWLTEHKIKKLNAFRARRLEKCFSSVKALRGLSLEDALAIAKRRSRGAAPEQARQKIRRRLRRIAENLIATAKEITGIDGPGSFLDEIDLADRGLQAVRAAVEPHRRKRPK